MRKTCIGFAVVIAGCGFAVPAMTQPQTEQVLTTGAVPVPAVEPEPEKRTLSLSHRWTRKRLKVVYKIGGDYQPEAMAQINHFMRDWRCKKTVEMDPKLIDLLYEVHQAVGGRGSIQVISAYRSEGYNASLLRAGRTVDPHSWHMFGRAIDIIIPRVRSSKIRDAAVKLGRGGVGYYPFSGPRFVHLDTGRVRQWEERDPKIRRQLKLPKRRRKRLKLDCSLKMETVLQKISREDVIAALPPGAATASSNVHRVAFIPGTGVPIPEGPENAAGAGATSSSQETHTCALAVSPPLALLTAAGENASAEQGKQLAEEQDGE